VWFALLYVNGTGNSTEDGVTCWKIGSSGWGDQQAWGSLRWRRPGACCRNPERSEGSPRKTKIGSSGRTRTYNPPVNSRVAPVGVDV